MIKAIFLVLIVQTAVSSEQILYSWSIYATTPAGEMGRIIIHKPSLEGIAVHIGAANYVFTDDTQDLCRAYGVNAIDSWAEYNPTYTVSSWAEKNDDGIYVPMTGNARYFIERLTCIFEKPLEKLETDIMTTVFTYSESFLRRIYNIPLVNIKFELID